MSGLLLGLLTCVACTGRLWVAMLQGIEDYEMLETIRRKDPAKADSIIRRMVTSFDDYRTDLVLYRRLRREILESAGL